MKITTIREIDAMNQYRDAYRAIYNNNIKENSYMLADFNTTYQPGSIIAITPAFPTFSKLWEYCQIKNNYTHTSDIRFIPNFIVNRF